MAKAWTFVSCSLFIVLWRSCGELVDECGVVFFWTDRPKLILVVLSSSRVSLLFLFAFLPAPQNRGYWFHVTKLSLVFTFRNTFVDGQLNKNVCQSNVTNS